MVIKYCVSNHLGAARHVFYVLCIGDHDNRKAISNSIKDDRYNYVGDWNRPNRLISASDLLRGSRSSTEVDSLGHGTFRHQFVYLLDATLHFWRATDWSKQAPLQHGKHERRHQRHERHNDSGQSMQIRRQV